MLQVVVADPKQPKPPKNTPRKQRRLIQIVVAENIGFYLQSRSYRFKNLPLQSGISR
jgi:hypothetical protein